MGPDGARCQTSVSGQPTNVTADGGTVNVTVTAARDCAWTASTEASWMQLSTTSGQGDASVGVTVARNDLPTARSGALVVNNQRLTVSQEARPCTIDLQGTSSRMSSDGGRGSFGVTTAAGCSWTATTSASWIRVVSASGNGAGTVQFDVAANTGGPREATVAVGDRQHTVSQVGAGEPAPAPPLGPACVATVDPTSVNVPVGGGTASVSLAINGACDWTASTTDDWITFTSPTTGRGNATIGLRAAANNGPARAATVTIAQQMIVVAQPAAAATPTCTYSVAPPTRNVRAATGSSSFTISTSEGCAWTASENADWLSLSRASGNGTTEIQYTFEANTQTTTRTATITSQGRTHTVRQDAAEPPAPPACTYSITPATRNIGSGAASGTFTITTNRNECEWNATSDSQWVSLNRREGTGTGDVSYTVQPNTDRASRTATISAQNQTLRITQEGAPAPTPTCTFQLDSASRSFPNNGGSHTVRVTASPADCAGTWQVSGAQDWIQVTGGSGSASGEFSYTVSNNGGTAQRTATLTVGNQQHQITQAGTPAPTPTCTFQLNPTSNSVGNTAGGPFTVQVTAAPAGCVGTWSVTGAPDWVQVNGGSGSGSGQFSYNVAPNGGTEPRTAPLTVGTQQHTITQAGTPAPTPTCTFQLNPPSNSVGNTGGGPFTVQVTAAPAGCVGTWSVTNAPEWVQVSNGSGSASGAFSYSVLPNGGTDQRTANLTVGTQTHQITQAGTPAPTPTCTFQLNPTSNSVGNTGGGPFTVQVTAAPAGCVGTWSVTNAPEWVQVSNGSGSASGAFSYNILPNGGSVQRTATLTVGSQPHTITQAGTPAPTPQVCTYTIDPSRRRFEEDGGEGQVRVTTDRTCAWQASTSANWITIVAGSGTGPGEVRYRVARLDDDGDDRRATITIAGQTHEVEQREDDDLSSWDVAYYVAALSHPPLVPSRRVRV